MPGDRQVDRATRDSRRSGMAQFWTAATALQGQTKNKPGTNAGDDRNAAGLAAEGPKTSSVLIVCGEGPGVLEVSQPERCKVG